MENGTYLFIIVCFFLVDFWFIFRIFIGIQKLLALIDMARQTDERMRVIKLITKLEEDGALEDPGMA